MLYNPEWHKTLVFLFFWPFAPVPQATMAFADFSLCLYVVAFSGIREVSSQVRTHFISAQPPDIQRLNLVHNNFEVFCLRFAWTHLIYDSYSSPHSFAPRFIDRLSCLHAVALRIVRCGKHMEGLSPQILLT
jgi:hypothetical protein